MRLRARSRGRATRSRAARPTRRTHPPYASARRPPRRASAATRRRTVRLCRSRRPTPYGGGRIRALGAAARAAVLSSHLSRRKNDSAPGVPHLLRQPRFGMSRVIKDRPTSILPPACRSVKTLSGAPPDGLKIRTAEAAGQYVRRFTGWRSDAYDLPPRPPFPRKFSKARASSLVIGGPSAGVISAPGVAHPRRPCVPCSRSRLRLSKGMSVLM